MDDVVTRSRVSKASIYRRWTSKRLLILDAVGSCLPLEFSHRDLGSLDEDARALLVDVADLLAAPQSAAARQLLPHLWSWPELADAYRAGVRAPWETAMAAVVDRAHGRGEITDPARCRTALGAAAGALITAWTVSPRTIELDPAADRTRVDELVDVLLRPQRLA